MKFKRLLVLWLVEGLILGYGVGSSTSVVIHAFDQNPAGSDSGNEWVVLYNPADSDVNIGGWTLSSTHGSTSVVVIPIGTVISANGYWRYTHSKLWLDSTEESIILRDTENHEVDRTITANDDSNDNRYWIRNPNGSYIGPTSNWSFRLQTLEKGILRNGTCVYVVDGDTIDISPVEIVGIQRIRLVGIDTPEKDDEGYEEAKNFTIDICLGKEIEFDVDDEKQYDNENRILAVVYVGGTNLNRELLCNEYAEVLYMPPSEFNPYSWYNSCTPLSNFTSVIVSPSSITLGNVNVTVTITVINATSSENVSNANVSISGAGITSASALTVNGTATFTSVTPTSAGTITVTVTKSGYNDGSATIAVVTTTTTSTTTTSTTTTSTTTTSTTTTTLPSCNGDANNDGTVSDFELLNYIDSWAKGNVSDFDLLKAIDNWAKGYC